MVESADMVIRPSAAVSPPGPAVLAGGERVRAGCG